MKKLLVIGTDTIHTYNYIALIEDYFDDILLITDIIKKEEKVKAITADFSLKPANLFKTPKRIKKIVEDFNPDVVHIHQANSVAFFSLLSGVSKKYPTVLTAWGSDILVVPKKSWLLKKMVQYNLNKAQYFTSDSQFMADEMMVLNNKVKKVLIANFGINVEVQDVPKENIIYSNRLHKPLYNIDQIIDSFADFAKVEEEWKLVIGATGESTDALKAKVTKMKLEDKITFVGWVNKEVNASWYSKAKIWASIPDSDATSISLLEAMACGCIPVVSDLPANHEWVQDNVNGIIVAKTEENFFQRALQIDAEKAIEINKKRIEKDGLKSANKQKFINLYCEMLQDE
jgi:glycosyltransferase involved in cell wall biosynthesis